MKTTKLIIGLLLSAGSILAQAPILYIHIVSHNEPTDNIESSALIFNKFKNNAMQMANIINSKNAKWNLQTSDGFILGALQYQSAGTSSTDIFETLSNPPYNDNIEIDPRPKNKDGRNIADQFYLLDSIGANPTKIVGGFLWYQCPNSSFQPDWWQYQDTIIGNIYNNKVKFDILSGAGSLNHCNDLNDFGIFKPDTITNFYQHNPNRKIWCIGTGCAPKLDSLDDEQAIIDLIQGQVDSIQNGLWPQNKFYVTRIMTNQREYGPLFFQKISKVIDSLNLIPSTKLQWATIGETFTAFQTWQTNSGLDHSQWLCGQTTAGVENFETYNKFIIHPNPFSNLVSIDFPDNQEHKIEVVNNLGIILYSKIINSSTTFDLSNFPSGIYLMRVDSRTEKIIKY
ncbi:MAG: T9SS type A sorting domain-containing protein [Bacteroidota bacterium]